MRKIDRRFVAAPSSLSEAKAKAAKADLRRHYALPREARRQRRAPFVQQILSGIDLHQALLELFHQKCAFCEQSLQRSNDRLAHFRPLSAAADLRGEVSPDHYGWLAYEWQNLLLVCARCQKAKRNVFPVDGPRAPMLCTWREAEEAESPMLLDPCNDTPTDHLRILLDGHLIPRTTRGRMTIEVLDLNRYELVSLRCGHIESLIRRFDTLLADESAFAALRPFPKHDWSIGDSDPFSGITRMFFRQIFEELPKNFKYRRFPTRDFVTVIPELLSSIPGRQWEAARSIAFSPHAVVEREIVPEILQSEMAPYDTLYEDRWASRYITALTLKNFKGIHRIEVKLSNPVTRFGAPCVMLLGENATGKSTILQAICLALMTPSARKRLGVSPEDFVSRAKDTWFMIGAEPAIAVIEFDDGGSLELTIDGEHSEFSGEGSSSQVVLAYGARRIFSTGPAKRLASSTNRTLFDPFAVISDATTWLQQSTDEQFDAVVRAMREVLALEIDDHIFRDDDGNIVVHAHGRNTPIGRMSDGYKSIFGMAVDVMRRMVERWNNLEEARGIVLIDEIETHLHPRWKMQVMGALRRAMPQVQFIATTHDPLCLRGMKDGEVHVFERDARGEVVEIPDLPSVQGLRNEQLLTSDYFGLSSTSDAEFERLLDRYAAARSKEGIYAPTGREIVDKLAEEISKKTIIGNTPAEQVIAEALTEFLIRRRARRIDRKELREEAVQTVLSALETAFEDEIDDIR